LIPFIDGSFYYSIEILDSSRGISYWKCIDMPDNKINEEYSFYAIDKAKINYQHLEKQNCSNINRIKDWVGEYTCTIEATDGETNKDIQVTFKLVMANLTHIEFSNERFKVRIQGDLTDTNRIQGDVVEVIDGKDGFPVTSDPFIVIEKYEDVMLVTCPLITHDPGFGSTPYVFEKVGSE
jgi:hypothetical protein